MIVLSFDVWNTLLSTRVFYRKFSASLFRITGWSSEEIFEKVLKVYSRIKSMRLEELIDENRIVEHCTDVLLEELKGLKREQVKKALAYVAARENLEDLILDDSRRVVSEFKRRGYAIITVGNVVFWPGAYNRIILERLGYSEYFTVQIYADEVKCLKPRPCIFHQALRALREYGIEPDEVVHVGDSFREDFLGALGVGFKAVLVDRDKKYSEGGISEILKDRAYVIENLEGLFKII